MKKVLTFFLITAILLTASGLTGTAFAAQLTARSYLIRWPEPAAEQAMGCEASAQVSGAFGRQSGDVSLKMDGLSTRTFIYYTMPELSVDAENDLIYEASFVPPSNAEYVSVVGAQNRQFGFGRIPVSAFHLNQWNKIKVVYSHRDSIAAVYVNGSYYAADYKTTEAPTLFRLLFGASSARAMTAYVDDVFVYQNGCDVEKQEEQPALTGSGAAYTVDTGSMTLEISSLGTVAELKELLGQDTSAEIRVYTAGYAAVLGDGAGVAPGNLVVLATADGIYQTFTIKAPAATDERTYLYQTAGDNASDGLGTARTVVAGAFGKTASDNAFKIEKDCADTSANIYFGSKDLTGVNTGRDLIFEASFVPMSNTADIFIGTAGHASIGLGRIPVSVFYLNQWNKIKVVWNFASRTAAVYINGQFYMTCENMSENIPSVLRLIFRPEAAGILTAYVDDVFVYQNGTGFENREEAAALTEDGENYLVDTVQRILTAEACTAAELKAQFAADGTEVRVYAPGFASEWDGAAQMTDGCLVVFVTEDNIYQTFTFQTLDRNKIYFGGSGYYDETRFTKGTLRIQALTSRPAVMLIAQYGKNGALLHAETANTASAGWIKASYTPLEQAGTLKVLLWDGLQSAQPLADAAALTYRQDLSVLIIGNSFSTDSTKYLREIAAAADININLGRLIKGGSDLKHHYETRETTEAVNMLYYNGTATGYTNLKQVLESPLYDWDYIAIQNWSSTLTSDAWSYAPDLVRYIHEKAPGAEIIINKIWSFELGYHYGSTDTVTPELRAQVDQSLAELTENAAVQGGAAIGTGPLRIVPAGDAFTAARNYTDGNGVRLFDTTYYAEGHQFTADMNRQTIPVGQGILSPEEEAAGLIRLNRDGFHASLLGRYMLAATWFEALTGESIVGNTFVPEGDSLDSGAVVMDEAGSLVVYYQFDAPPQERIDLVQELVHHMMQANQDWR